jgi:hypothetical protein
MKFASDPAVLIDVMTGRAGPFAGCVTVPEPVKVKVFMDELRVKVVEPLAPANAPVPPITVPVTV